jgi:hypothetical protein
MLLFVHKLYVLTSLKIGTAWLKLPAVPILLLFSPVEQSGRRGKCIADL